MAAVNGKPTPPPQQAAPLSPTPSAKRKRSTAGDAAATVQVSASNHDGASPLNGDARDDPTTRRLQPTLEHILRVLQDYDPKPSVLERPVDSSTSRAPSGESDSKRAKLTTSTGNPSIASLVRSSAYASLDAFEKDVENVTSAALAPLETDVLSAPSLSADQMKLHADILGLRKRARILIAREGARLAHAAAKRASTHLAADEAAVNGDVTVKEEPGDEEQESRTVLTLYGTAQGPKQLFSSLQEPVTIRPKQEGAPSTLDGSVKVTLPLRESQLPNIISTTQVFPLPEDVDRKGRPKTFGEVFPPPAHHQPLAPPKFPKPQSAKGNTITWVPQEPLDVPARNKSSHIYSNQKLAAGQWLGYGGVDMPKDVTSPTAKQKSRQRALSTGEAQLPPSEATLAAVQSAKQDALFRSVFSSFAPSRDDSQAIVPTEVKNMVWWHKVGRKRFEETFPAEDPPIDPALLAVQEPVEAGIETENDKEPVDEVEAFRELAENYIPDESDPFEATDKTQAEKDTDEILQEISELIETLASHQRIRNSSLATNPLTPALQNSSLASLAGSPSTPSSEEIDVYHLLKSQLTLLISQLPPYAVAKLNGDQLNELNISRTLIIETEDHKGVLEEDQFTRRASMPAAVAPPSLSRMGSSGSTHQQYAASGPQYGRGTPAVFSASSRQAQAMPAYHAQHGLHRTPSVSYAPRPAAPTASYQTPAPAYNNATQRPAYNPSQYAQQTPRTGYAQQPPVGQHYPQRPAAPASTYGAAQNQQYHQSTPQTGMRSSVWSSQQMQNGYYQRPQPNGQNPAYNATPAARTGSPMKPAPSAAQPAPAMRGAYGTPIPNAHQRSSYYAPQYAGSPQPSTPAPATTVAYNPIGANPQQMMMDRQQAQAQAQNQARLAAQNSFHRQGSGSATPQPQPLTPQPQPQPPSQYGGGGQQQQPPPNGAGASPVAV